MQNGIIIHNLRLGLATNSSSSHSLIFLAKKYPVKDDDINDGEFGWNFFTAASRETKLDYLALLLKQGLGQYDMDESQRKALITEWIGSHEIKDSLWEDGYIDHQSVIYMPSEFGGKKGNRQFFKEFKEMILSSDVVIGGGNDNTDQEHDLLKIRENKAMSMSSSPMSYRHYIARKDEKWDFWTLFQPDNGNRIRFSFHKPATLMGVDTDSEEKQYVGEKLVVTRASTPELVDYKITDFCSENCAYCAPAGTEILTPNGLVNIEDISIGNEVTTYDPYSKTSKTEYVDQIYINDYSGDLIEVEIEDGTTLRLTPNHEVFVQAKGWILAEFLEEDDELIMVKDDQKEEHRTMVLS